MSDKTHSALVIVGARQPYEVRQFPTKTPKDDEVLVKVLWTASSPVDLHRMDGGLLLDPPTRTGSSCTGVVVKAGNAVQHLKPGDRVFGQGRQEPDEFPHQEFVTGPAWTFGKIPDSVSDEEAVTVPTNFITVFHLMLTDLHLPAPWPKPEGYVPPRADEAILVWGAASSVGQYTLQILHFYGYRNLIATASPNNHQHLRELGAAEVYDYRSPTIVDDILGAHPSKDGVAPAIPMIIDCIGSVPGSVRHIARLAQRGSVAALMLPAILKHASKDQVPEYAMDFTPLVDWAEGVTVRGVRAHFYWRNQYHVDMVQKTIMPDMLVQGIVKPNRYRVIEGKDIVERATNALNLLREGVSAEKLVWRVSEE